MDIISARGVPKALNGLHDGSRLGISCHAECRDGEELHELLDEGLKRSFNRARADGSASQDDVPRDAGQHQLQREPATACNTLAFRLPATTCRDAG